MTKAEIIDVLAEDVMGRVTKKDLAQIIGKFLGMMYEEAYANGRSAYCSYIWKRKDYKERKCRNPRTGAPLTVPASSKVVLTIKPKKQ